MPSRPLSSDRRELEECSEIVMVPKLQKSKWIHNIRKVIEVRITGA